MTTLDWHYKGLPLDLGEIELADIGKPGSTCWATYDAEVMVLLRDPLADNIAAMAAWCAERDLLLAPHGKSTMAPQIFERQLAAGAWGAHVRDPWHLRVCREVGVQRVVYANELVEPAALRYVAAELARDPAFEIYCLADSVAGVEIMQRELAAAGAPRPINVLVEVGHEGGRCGCRTVEEAVAVAEAISAAPLLDLAGVEAFEGLRAAKDLEPRWRAWTRSWRAARGVRARRAPPSGKAGPDGRRQRVLRSRRAGLRGPARHGPHSQRLLRDPGRRSLRPRLAARQRPRRPVPQRDGDVGRRCCRDPSRASW